MSNKNMPCVTFLLIDIIFGVNQDNINSLSTTFDPKKTFKTNIKIKVYFRGQLTNRTSNVA